MRRQHCFEVLSGLVAVALLAADASATYHPTLGRWLQRDPIGYADGMGLYEYVRGGPTVNADASGLQQSHEDKIRQRALGAIRSVRSADRLYSADIGLGKLADRLKQGLDHVKRITPTPPKGATGGYDTGSDELQVPDFVDDGTLVHELLHAYDDAAGIVSTWPSSYNAEVLAAAIGAIRIDLVYLDGVERAIGEGGPCQTVQNQWASFWKALVMDFNGDEEPKQAVPVRWTLFGVERNGRLTFSNAEAAMKRVGMSISCPKLRDTYNDIMKTRNILDEQSGGCCTVKCPDGLPKCFRGN